MEIRSGFLKGMDAKLIKLKLGFFSCNFAGLNDENKKSGIWDYPIPNYFDCLALNLMRESPFENKK